MEAREVAAIKAAHDYLNMDNGHSNIPLSDSPKTDAEEVIATCRRLLNPSGGSVDSAGQACCPSTFKTSKCMIFIRKGKSRSCVVDSS